MTRDEDMDISKHSEIEQALLHREQIWMVNWVQHSSLLSLTPTNLWGNTPLKSFTILTLFSPAIRVPFSRQKINPWFRVSSYKHCPLGMRQLVSFQLILYAQLLQSYSHFMKKLRVGRKEAPHLKVL